jgi:hypothetical protein
MIYSTYCSYILLLYILVEPFISFEKWWRNCVSKDCLLKGVTVYVHSAETLLHHQDIAENIFRFFQVCLVFLVTSNPETWVSRRFSIHNLFLKYF